MTPERASEWIRISHKIAGLFPPDSPYHIGPLITLQRLARFEEDIDKMESELHASRQTGDPNPIQFDGVASYTVFWVLAAYEIARTLANELNDDKLKATRDKLARLRIPLAKLEASQKNKATDFAFPWPRFSSEKGTVAWEVNQQMVLTREELSNDLFTALREFVERGGATTRT